MCLVVLVPAIVVGLSKVSDGYPLGKSVELWQASVADDLKSMRAVNERLYPIVKSIYGPAPIVDMHTRMKVGLKTLGLIRNSDPRPPLLPVLPVLCDAISTTIGAARRAGDIRLA